MDLVSDSADPVRARSFATNEVRPGVTRVLIRERERAPFTDAYRGPGVRILLDGIVEFGDRARIATWQVDVRGGPDSWRIVAQEVLTSVEGISTGCRSHRRASTRPAISQSGPKDSS